VVTFVCDSGNKYLSKMYNDVWMRDQGFMHKPRHNDLRDLISHAHSDSDTVVAAPTDSLINALNRMKLYDISQLPVIDNKKVIGLLDESDILLAVIGAEEKFDDEVATVMSTTLETIDASQPLEDLLPLFQRNLVPIVMHNNDFAGLITRIDLLNHLRDRVNRY